MTDAALPIPGVDPYVAYPVTTSTTGPFIIPFPLPRAWEGALRCSVDGVELDSDAFVFSPDDAVAGGYPSGEAVLLAAVENVTVEFWRDSPITRTADYAQGPLDFDTFNAELSLITMQVQDARLRNKRSELWTGGVADVAVSVAWAAIVTEPTIAAGLLQAGLGITDAPQFGGLVIRPAAASDDRGLDILQTGPTTGDHGASHWFNHILVDSEAMDVDTDAAALRVGHSFGGANLKGQRAPIIAHGFFYAASSPSNPTPIYSGIASIMEASVPDGGINTTLGGSRGSLLGGNSNVILQAGALNWYRVTGWEINSALRTGSSAAIHQGLLITQYHDHVVSASVTDVAAHVVNQIGAVGWAHWGIFFDGGSSFAGTLFKNTATVIGGTGAVAVTNIIDFATFTASDYSLRLPNFSINGAGSQIRRTGTALSELLIQSGAAANSGKWQTILSAGVWSLQTLNDAEDTGSEVMSATRSGASALLLRTPLSLHIQRSTAIPAGGTADVGLLMSTTASFGVFFGSGEPALSAARGSVYIRSDGNGIYVNVDGATGWMWLSPDCLRPIFRLEAANMNSTADQQFTKLGIFTSYLVNNIVGYNGSASCASAIGGVYTGALKTGNQLIAASQAYTGFNSANNGQGLTITSGQNSARVPNTATPYLSLSTPHGSAATLDLVIFGYPLLF